MNKTPNKVSLGGNYGDKLNSLEKTNLFKRSELNTKTTTQT